MRYSYAKAKELLRDVLGDFRILSGDEVGPSDVTWRDVAGTCMTNLSCLANMLSGAREGNHESCPVFPSPDDLDD